MKKFKYIISIALLSMMAVSCSLQEKNHTDVQKDKFIRNAKEAETVLLGVYRNMMTDGMYSYNLATLFTLPSDEAKVEGSSTDNSWRSIASNHYETSIGEVEKTWASLYSAVYDANDFLDRIGKSIVNFDEADQAKAKVYIGEAKTLRALYYFELVRLFNKIAVVKDPKDSYKLPTEFKQVSAEETYTFIEEDLKDAIELLPYATQKNEFRITKGSAMGLLAKVYATWAGYPVGNTAKWTDCATIAQKLIGDPNSPHGLLENFEDLWINSANNVWNPKESLIEISFYSPTMTGQAANDPSGRIGKWNGVLADNNAMFENSPKIEGRWRVLPTFVKGWTDYDKDLRWKISFCPYKKYTVSGHEAYFNKDKADTNLELMMQDDPSVKRDKLTNDITPGKWDIPRFCNRNNVLIDANYSNVNWYILRYADVLLIYAEALNEIGKTGEAYEFVNQVRRRAYGLPADIASSEADLAPGMSQDEFRNAIRTERAHELAFEGHRKQDLIRWGDYAGDIKKTYYALAEFDDNAPDKFTAGKYTTRNKHELLPIPQREIDLMKFEQNPGW